MSRCDKWSWTNRILLSLSLSKIWPKKWNKNSFGAVGAKTEKSWYREGKRNPSGPRDKPRMGGENADFDRIEDACQRERREQACLEQLAESRHWRAAEHWSEDVQTPASGSAVWNRLPALASGRPGLMTAPTLRCAWNPLTCLHVSLN